jgi:uncharacterized metal-binding protein YceD (DUF177 family)
LATRFALPALDRLTADLRLKRTGAGVIRLSGHMDAVATQSCIVSLAPVAATLAVDFELFFTEDVRATEAELTMEYDQDDPPEPITGGQINLGEVVAEQLGLNLDPYPRAPGATLPANVPVISVDTADQAPRRNPFEALKGLKSREDNG